MTKNISEKNPPITWTGKTKRADEIKAGDYVSVTSADRKVKHSELDAALVIEVQPALPVLGGGLVKIVTFDGTIRREGEFIASVRLRTYQTYAAQRV